ncbi:MAG: hypothetical protein ACFFGZ_10275 [Candidatus Thorarchaeota archaeon]
MNNQSRLAVILIVFGMCYLIFFFIFDHFFWTTLLDRPSMVIVAINNIGDALEFLFDHLELAVVILICILIAIPASIVTYIVMNFLGQQGWV